ncbi:MAG: hypothetical protein E7562_04285 [Ruminococcaceae bacterium]|nr:hypothetical protein [Oscillospiraceae bacterium]
MKLKKHSKNIVDVDSWYNECPPKKGEKQWADGRSAKELAKYITKSLPNVPAEIEKAINTIVPADAEFDWDAEYVTSLPGYGEGRNHDAILFNDDIVITIEAKADETLGDFIGEEIKNASVNKLYRISNLLEYIFKGGFKNYQNLRYQLLTASVGTLLEAQKNDCDTAVLIVLVFKSNGKVTEEKVASNHRDVEAFLNATGAYEENGLYIVPNNTDIKLYFKEIVL